MAKNPNDIAEKWANRMGAASTEVQKGVMAVTTAPTQLAAAKEQKYLAGVQRAVTEGKYKRGLERVSLSDWQQSMIQKGIPRMAQGAQAGKPKVAAFMADMLPFQETLRSQLSAMPDNSLEENIARQAFWTRGMAKYKR